MTDKETTPKKSKLRAILSYTQSVLGMFVGIQSNEKREEDMKDGLERMIYAGLGTLVLFVIVVVAAVKIALPS
ncbi:DUF2970 domain-containing protein [Oceanospirillaceae bacterium]|jgi:hypothetical protein|uniref:DUF2970 domain-containing protein n=1 Tax=Candidatus Njordibacter sp. Uisw_002 TaxID=3230971 RepID=UPI002374F292|nr:DUF2970 domain-containing protein [Oceanospirillaceae bacterium]MDC1341760.1 DUF2970 domain-containing protein [Oceanospirillaceae bacterium]|tara:strand:- start:927 stop:1145 length:219 start_codon:yes stop_codon:yes gene_type:complete